MLKTPPESDVQTRGSLFRAACFLTSLRERFRLIFAVLACARHHARRRSPVTAFLACCTFCHLRWPGSGGWFHLAGTPIRALWIPRGCRVKALAPTGPLQRAAVWIKPICCSASSKRTRECATSFVPTDTLALAAWACWPNGSGG